MLHRPRQTRLARKCGPMQPAQPQNRVSLQRRRIPRTRRVSPFHPLRLHHLPAVLVFPVCNIHRRYILGNIPPDILGLETGTGETGEIAVGGEGLGENAGAVEVLEVVLDGNPVCLETGRGRGKGLCCGVGEGAVGEVVGETSGVGFGGGEAGEGEGEEGEEDLHDGKCCVFETKKA